MNDFAVSVVESNQGRRAHAGVRVELKAVSGEVMRLVGLLDILNRYRFSGNAEMKAAWEGAKNVGSGRARRRRTRRRRRRRREKARPAA